MSTLTKIWTEEKIRDIIRHLDEKIGLNGAALPIRFGKRHNTLGMYSSEPGDEHFFFSLTYLNDPDYEERAAIDLIRHEYSHFYVQAAGISKYIPSSARAWHHGDDWKWACKMVGADPIRCYTKERFVGRSINLEEAQFLYNAGDIDDVRILSYIEKWDQLPPEKEWRERQEQYIKEHIACGYCSIGDEVLHPSRGFGIVEDCIASDYHTQKIYVHFEDESFGTFTNTELCKVVDGVAMTYRH